MTAHLNIVHIRIDFQLLLCNCGFSLLRTRCHLYLKLKLVYVWFFWIFHLPCKAKMWHWQSLEIGIIQPIDRKTFCMRKSIREEAINNRVKCLNYFVALHFLFFFFDEFYGPHSMHWQNVKRYC